MDFPELLLRARRSNHMLPKRLIALDPGETTGYASFIEGKLAGVKEFPTHDVPKSVVILEELFEKVKPDFVVYENYKVYSWKTDTHAWNTLHTPRLIGCIQTLCTLRNIRMHTQMASIPKGFCTDKKLQEWKYYYPSMRHARDAIRHGCYYLLFGPHKDDVMDNLQHLPKNEK